MDVLKILLVVCACSFSAFAQSEDRLSKIEASLELVLEKNADLEQYVKQLEKKNAQLEERIDHLEKKQVEPSNANNGMPNQRIVEPSQKNGVEQQTQINRQFKSKYIFVLSFLYLLFYVNLFLNAIICTGNL